MIKKSVVKIQSLVVNQASQPVKLNSVVFKEKAYIKDE